jgi:hypothetical protein
VHNNSFFKNAWNEYLVFLSKFIPKAVLDKFLTRKNIKIILALLCIEAIIISFIFAIY